MTQKITAQEILEKEFHIDFKGYNPLEVDQFLDDVMKDYEMFEKIIAEQKELLDRYEDALSGQKKMLAEYEGRSRAERDIQPQASYVDLIRRVSKLEEAVFKR